MATSSKADVSSKGANVVEHPGKDQLKESEKKWGVRTANSGWTFLPNLLITHQRKLGLDLIDLAIILVLMTHWWKADELPFPSKAKIAKIINVDPSTVRKHIQRLETDSLLSRTERRRAHDRSETNVYGFEGLVKALNKIAIEEASIKEAAEQERDRRALLKPKGRKTAGGAS